MTLEHEPRYWHSKAKEARVVREQLSDTRARPLMATVVATDAELAENAKRLGEPRAGSVSGLSSRTDRSVEVRDGSVR
jgi:hypothetical protein